jgi:hypothetical protein
MTRVKWAIVLAVMVGISGCQVAERRPIAVGTHVICDAGDQGTPHLPLNSRVFIHPLGADTRPTEVDFPDGTRVVLATIRSAALAGAYTLGGEQHYIRIRPDPDYRKNNPRGTCTGENVHIIELCFKEDNAWRCADGRGHYGHVHSQPSG